MPRYFEAIFFVNDDNHLLQAITRSRAANSKKEVKTKATLGLKPQLQSKIVFLEFIPISSGQ